MSSANDAGTGGGRGWRGPALVRCRTSTPSNARHARRAAVAGLLLPALLCVSTPARAQQPRAEDKNPLSTEISFAQFVQGPVSGGLEEKGEYGGKVDVELKVDMGKLRLIPGGSLDAKLSTRYGEQATRHVGAAIPINTALIDPAADGTVTSLVALNYTQLIPLGKKPGNALAIAFGRFSTLELIPDGTGMTGYMNVGQIAPTHEARNVPLVTMGVTMALVMKGQPVATLLIIDSKNSATTSGLDDLFENGVTLSPAISIPTRFFRRSGHQGLRATWSSQDLVVFDRIPQFDLPLPDTAVSLDRESGGWSITYLADQYVQENAGPPHTGWRVYWQAGMADERTNPIGRYFNVGVAGNSPFRGRMRDNFGVGWAYTGWGDDFQDLLAPLVEIDDEQSLELFYNWAILPWIRLTGDLQVVWPFRPAAETAIVPAARLQLVF